MEFTADVSVAAILAHPDPRGFMVWCLACDWWVTIVGVQGNDFYTVLDARTRETFIAHRSDFSEYPQGA